MVDAKIGNCIGHHFCHRSVKLGNVLYASDIKPFESFAWAKSVVTMIKQLLSRMKWKHEICSPDLNCVTIAIVINKGV